MNQKSFKQKIGNALISGVESGSGKPIIFLHAGVADKRMWEHQINFFSKQFRTIAYDRRGFGETVSPDEAFANVEDLSKLLANLEIDRATLVGCSQGGKIAIDFTLKYPEKVEKLVLIAPAISGAIYPDKYPEPAQSYLDELDTCEDLERINELEAYLWLDGAVSPPNRVSQNLRDLFLDMNGIALKMPDLEKEIEPPSAFERISEIPVPTLVLWGNFDFPFKQKHCQHLVATIKKSKGVMIEDTAHLPNLEKPDYVNQLIHSFLIS